MRCIKESKSGVLSIGSKAPKYGSFQFQGARDENPVFTTPEQAASRIFKHSNRTSPPKKKFAGSREKLG